MAELAPLPSPVVPIPSIAPSKHPPTPRMESISREAMNYSHLLLRQLRQKSAEIKSIICDICGVRHKVRSHILLHMAMHIDAKNFKCPDCAKAFNTRNLLEMHASVYHKNPHHNLACEFCGALFRRHWNLTVHQRLHTGEQPYGCDQCGQTFVYSKDLVIHKRINVGDMPYHCKKCPVRFDSRSQLTAHMRATHRERRHKCDQCEKSFFESTELKRHQVVHTGWQFRCPVCQKAFSRHNSMQAHLNAHADNKIHKCGFCQMAFYSTARKRVHEKSKHKIEFSAKQSNICPEKSLDTETLDSPFSHKLSFSQTKDKTDVDTDITKSVSSTVLSSSDALDELYAMNLNGEQSEEEVVDPSQSCEIVQQFSVNSYQDFRSDDSIVVSIDASPQIEHISSDGRKYSNLLLRQLRQISGLSKNIVCDICGARQKMRSHILQHMAMHINAKQFKCPTCIKSFNTNGALETHTSTHNEPLKKHSCEICGRLFRTIWNLSVHQRLHTGERRYCCDECGERFVHSKDLVIHQRIHRGEMPFRCQACPMRFIKRSELAKHLKQHVIDQRHKCEHCAKTFYESTDLKRHMVSHTGWQFNCPVCRKAFSRQNSMRVHMNIHAGVKPFACRHCDRKFYSTSRRRVHEKTLHQSDAK